ncbi:MAG TPA: PA domain-containing protein, partial [Edaphobacter sp.]
MLLRPALCLLLATSLAAPLSAQSSAQSSDSIRTDDLKADIYFLASDDLAGRNSGSLEDHIATDYIASEFLRLGLKPMGDNGTFFQGMNILTGRVDPEHTTLTATVNGSDHSYSFGQDLQLARQSIRNTKACGDVVFAGYGISAPEFGYDDLAGLDLKGKVALVFLREPQANDPNSKLMGTLDTYHAFNWQKIEELRKRGAAGILIVQDRVPRPVKLIPPTSPRPTGEPSYALDGEMWDIPVFLLKRDAADQLLAPSGKTADELQASIDQLLQPASIAVPKSSACLTKTFNEIQTHKGRNVLALLAGSDPKLAPQTIVLTAHHDHMGVSNGHIYHGADDNASGI